MKNLKQLGALFLSIILTLTLTISVPAFAAVDDTGYSDTDADAWYAEAVVYCRESNIMDGVGNNRFDPEGSLTRAALAAVLYRIAGTPSVTGADTFTDTDNGKWYSNAVLWASQRGLVGGYGSGLFGTNDPVSRQDMAVILWRYAGSPAAEVSMDFADKSVISGGLEDEDMAQYDIVFLGYPIWGGQAPKIISTFLENYDFTGKTIVPFCTSNSSGIGSSAANLRNLASAAAWMEGQRFSGSAPQSAVESWAGNLDIN